MSAASPSTDLTIPDNLPEDIKHTDVQAFLNYNTSKEEYDLDNKHIIIKVIKNQEVAGMDLLELTKEDLLTELY